METLQAITQEIIAQVEGATVTDETKFEESFVDAIVNQVRADLFRQNKNTIISKQWQQSYYPDYSEYINDYGECKVTFNVPAAILQGDGTEVITYVGPADGRIGYARVGIYGSASVDFAHPLTNPYKKGSISYDIHYENSIGNTQIEIYGNIDIRTFRVDLIQFNPMDNPSYRRSTDNYPISGELLVLLKTGVMNKLMVQMAQVPSDNISNSEDLQNQPRGK